MAQVRQRGPRLSAGPAIERFVKVVETGRLTEGPYVAEFEKRVSERASRQVYAVSSGAAALDIAFEAVVEQCDPRHVPFPRPLRVGVPTVGHWTDYSSVVRAGHEVVWLPVGPGGSLDPATVPLDGLNVLLWVPIGGWWDDQAARLLERRCHGADVALVVDASHATGNPAALGYGDIAVASLFATKCLTSGEGGIVAAKCPPIRKLVRSLRDGGRDTDAERTGREPWLHLATDRRMPETSAVLGLVSLETLNERMARRFEILERYRASAPESLHLVDTSEGLYKALVLAPDAATAAEFRSHLEANGVTAPSGVFDVALPDMGAVPSVWQGAALESGREWAERHVALPFHETMPDEEVAVVCAALDAWPA